MEQKKTSLINWITNLKDESVINQIDGFRNSSLDNLPNEIVKLLNISDAANENDCIEHTNARTLIGNQ